MKLIAFLCFTFALACQALRLRSSGQLEAPVGDSWIVAAASGNSTVNGTTFMWISPPEEEADDVVMSNTSCNAYWPEPLTSGEYYFELNYVSTETAPIAVGLTNMTRFKPNLNPIGLLYDGYLSTGTDIGISEIPFGPLPNSPTTVGMLVSFKTPGRLRISYFSDNSPLGLAYDVPASVLPNPYVAVQLISSGMVSILKAKIPTKKMPSNQDIAGEWFAVGLSQNSTEVPHVGLNVSISIASPIEKNDALVRGLADPSADRSRWVQIRNTDAKRILLTYKEAGPTHNWKTGSFLEDIDTEDVLRLWAENLFQDPNFIEIDPDQTLVVKKAGLEGRFKRQTTPLITTSPF